MAKPHSPYGHPPYNVNGEGGRPPIYTPEFIENEAIAFELWLEDKNNLFMEDFAHERGYSRERVYEWIKVSGRFAHAHRIFKEKQEVTLYKGGLTGKLKHPMCALILSSAHNINVKTEQKISGDSTNPLSIIFNKIAGDSSDLVDEK